jgi:ADP-ribosylation factor 2-binding protein
MSAPAPTHPEEEVYDDDEDLGGTGTAEDDGDMTFAEDHQDDGNSDRHFDEIVGALEEMLVDEEFTSFQSAYLGQHCHEFEDNDENKLSYTTIFDTYVERMEAYIENYLSTRVPGFDMASFLEECEARGEEQLGGDAFDVLTSMSDFGEFKQLMLSQKQVSQWQPMENTGPGSPSAKKAAAAAAASSSSSSSSSKQQ